MDPAKLDQLRRVLADAATARILSRNYLCRAEELIAGLGRPEAERRAAEMVLEAWCEDWGPGETAEGLGVADVTAVLEDIAEEIEHRREVAVLEHQEDFR